MSKIITPELVRRYLRATDSGPRPSEDRALEERPGDQRLFGIIGQRIGIGPAEFCARLGMLAAAEMAEANRAERVLERDKYPPAIDVSHDVIGPHPEWSRHHTMVYAWLEIRDKLIEAAGVDPEACEATR